MSTEELLKPRYKVIADYPESPYLDGDVLNFTRPEGYHVDVYYNDRGEHGEAWDEEFFNQYPHLFKKLEWWEERKIEELPQYVKADERVWKVIQYDGMYVDVDDGGQPYPYYASDVLPATEEEYNASLTSK